MRSNEHKPGKENMTNTKTIPQNPPEIAGPTAPISALYIVGTMDRAEAEAAGLAVPDPDPNLPAKAWVDLSPATEGPGAVAYLQLDPATGKQVRTYMPKSLARTFNLPGNGAPLVYPITDTPATWGANYPMDPLDLASDDEAANLARALNGTVVPMHFYRYSPNGEPRKPLGIQLGNDVYAVGRLLKEKYEAGPNAQLFLQGRPVWVAPPAEKPAEGNVPVPMRALTPNETIVRDGSLMGGGEWIVALKTAAVANPSAATDGFTAQDRADLQSIKKAVLG
jgi:hypothetical protein